MSENDRKLKPTRVGVVVSDKMDKTVTVKVSRLVQHKLYKKTIRRSRTFLAHDHDNRCSVGDKVVIEQTRPLSKTKNWRVREILQH